MNRYPPIGHPPMPIPRTTRFRPSGPVITPDPEPPSTADQLGLTRHERMQLAALDNFTRTINHQ